IVCNLPTDVYRIVISIRRFAQVVSLSSDVRKPVVSAARISSLRLGLHLARMRAPSSLTEVTIAAIRFLEVWNTLGRIRPNEVPFDSFRIQVSEKCEFTVDRSVSFLDCLSMKFVFFDVEGCDFRKAASAKEFDKRFLCKGMPLVRALL